VATGKQLATLNHQKPVWAVSFSPDGRTLATRSNGNTAILLWEVATGKQLATLTHEWSMTGVSFSPDSRTLATGSDNKVVLWEVATDKQLATFENPGGLVADVSFSPDWRRLATASVGNTVVLWEAATGTHLATPTPQGLVTAVSFSPDGRTLATASRDNTAVLWEVATGKQLATLKHQKPVWAVSFSPNGRTLATAGYDNTVGLWQTVMPAPDEQERLRAWVRCKTGKAFDEQGVLQELSQEECLQAYRELERRGGDFLPRIDSHAWHRSQAIEAEAEKNWFAAIFHLNRLLAIEPDNIDFRQRRDRATEVLKQEDTKRLKKANK
jgi:dipeptidyl aminopeptidase/acylaminoacyl peptidase